MSVGWILLSSAFWVIIFEGDDVGTDVIADDGVRIGFLVGFLVGLGWDGVLVGLDDAGRCAMGLLVGLETAALTSLNDRSWIAK